MSTKVTLHVSDQDLEYSNDPWDAAYLALQAVNQVLKEKGVDISFKIHDHGDVEAVPDEFFGTKDEWIEIKEE